MESLRRFTQVAALHPTWDRLLHQADWCRSGPWEALVEMALEQAQERHYNGPNRWLGRFEMLSSGRIIPSRLLFSMIDSSRTFLQILVDVPETLAEIASLLAEEAGARGIELRDATTMPPPGASPVPAGRAHILAWLDGNMDRESLQGELLARLEAAFMRGGLAGEAGTRVSFSTVDAEDWVRKVRDSIHPVCVGRRLRVRPSWTPAKAGADRDLVEIVLDPGLAFGTGHHATTSLCLAALEDLLDRADGSEPGPSLLDVGTGSGILAIAAALLGARRCVGIDNDPMAVRVGRENAEDNGVADRVVITIDPPETLDELFDIVVANIHLGPLSELADSVAARVAPGGRLLLSGLLEDQAGPAEAAYAAQGLRPQERKLLDGWALVSMRKPIGAA